jgi:hypothetical protein
MVEKHQSISLSQLNVTASHSVLKQCQQCNINKDIECFGKVSKNKNGTYSRRKICSECRSLNRRIDYKKNKTKILSQNEQWRQSNLDKKKKYDNEYYQKNKEKILSQNKDPKRQLRNKLNKRKWVQKNREKIKNFPSYKKKKEYSLKSLKARLNNNPYFKLRTNVSKTIRKYLKKQNISKCNVSILKFLPYSIQEMKSHLENLFEPWMSWNNWGIYNAKTWDDTNKSTWTWQIDHVIPQSALYYQSMEDENFKKCWDLNNIRPLSAKENCLKSNKY